MHDVLVIGQVKGTSVYMLVDKNSKNRFHSINQYRHLVIDAICTYKQTGCNKIP